MTEPGIWMAAEIAESATVVRAVLDDAPRWAPAAQRAAAGVRGVALTARGSSDHACTYARYLLEQVVGVPVWPTAPSLVTRYDTHLDLDGVLAIAVSQSGRTPEIVAATERYRAAGARTVALTNDPDSDLAGAADVVIPLLAGPERAVPATKTFTATLTALAALGAALDSTGRFGLDAPAVIDAVATAVGSAADAAAVVEVLATAPVIVHLGRGYLLALASEAALKLTETTAVPNLAWSTVDFRHGPMALARHDVSTVIHVARGRVADDAATLADDLHRAGCRVVTVGEPLPGDLAHLGVPAGKLAEHLQPIVHAVRVQQVALGVARARGVDPDHPDGLNKVTATT